MVTPVRIRINVLIYILSCNTTLFQILQITPWYTLLLVPSQLQVEVVELFWLPVQLSWARKLLILSVQLFLSQDAVHTACLTILGAMQLFRLSVQLFLSQAAIANKIICTTIPEPGNYSDCLCHYSWTRQLDWLFKYSEARQLFRLFVHFSMRQKLFRQSVQLFLSQAAIKTICTTIPEPGSY
jgi:hypothetical protein